jgi:succinate dehydrogenase flavin-adding protein (antitoxin of CptAB toxin-antitoxin module)
MPIERELSKILAMPDEELFRWRANVRVILDDHDDAEMAALNQASLDEIVDRAGRAWSAAHDQ